MPQATIVTVAGAFGEKDIAKRIEKYFSVLKPGPKKQKLKVKEIQARRELIQFKKSDQTHLVLGFRAFGVPGERQIALRSRPKSWAGNELALFQRIREELGVPCYVRADADLYSDHGLLTMAAGIEHTKIETVIRAGLEEFNRLRNELVSEKDLKKPKNI